MSNDNVTPLRNFNLLKKYVICQINITRELLQQKIINVK